MKKFFNKENSSVFYLALTLAYFVLIVIGLVKKENITLSFIGFWANLILSEMSMRCDCSDKDK